MTRHNFIILILIFTLSQLSFVPHVSAFGFGNKKNEIQKELDNNPFLETEGIKLRVTEEKKGYVTIEMYEGNRKVREEIDKGLDILSNQVETNWLVNGASESEKKTVSILRSTISNVKDIKGVKDVMLIAAVNTDQDRGEDLYYEALKLWREKKYEQTFALIIQSAELGHVKSQSQAAAMYWEGLGVKKDIDKSIKWSLKAIDGGNITSFRRLGDIYQSQDNYSKAIDYYKKGADNDDLYSLNALAWLYATCPKRKYQNGKQAVNLALQLVKEKPYLGLDTLAAAYARDGQYSKAVETIEKAINISKSKNDGNVDLFNKRLKSYQNSKPVTE